MTINIPLHIHVKIHSLHFEAPGSKKPEYKLSSPKEQQGFKGKKKVKNPQTLLQIT